MNAGTRLQKLWRWNGRPLRVMIHHDDWDGKEGWAISWERWHPRGGWTTWRSYGGTGSLREVIARYRGYASEWRGFE